MLTHCPWRELPGLRLALFALACQGSPAGRSMPMYVVREREDGDRRDRGEQRFNLRGHRHDMLDQRVLEDHLRADERDDSWSQVDEPPIAVDEAGGERAAPP